MIDSIKTYIAQCPYLDEYTAVLINYLEDKVNAYSINNSPNTSPILSTDITGNQTRQYLFTFDSKLNWNSEIQQNIDNLNFYENFSNWLENNSNEDILPILYGELQAIKIEALTDGYIFQSNGEQAVYRIQCRLTYLKPIGSAELSL